MADPSLGLRCRGIGPAPANPGYCTKVSVPVRGVSRPVYAAHLANQPHRCARLELRGVRARVDAHAQRIAVVIADRPLRLPRRKLSDRGDLGYHAGHRDALTGHLYIHRAADVDSGEAILAHIE